MGLLDGKVGVIYGVRNDRSLAWGCAKSIAREGGRLVLSVFGEREQKEAEKLAGTLPEGSAIVRTCDLSKDDEIAALHADLAETVGGLDFIVHSVAFANRDELSGPFLGTSRAGFQLALDASAYSFVAVAKAAESMLNEGASLITLTYLGSERVVAAYNVMGIAKAALESCVRYMADDLGKRRIRVNAISAGPALTAAAIGISGFRDLYKETAARAPLGHNTSPEEVGDVAAFLVSDWARAVTGDIIFVDNGLHILAR
ncbi:MAG: enoyl-ACP reductase [Capsulimonadaceae bacterium]